MKFLSKAFLTGSAFLLFAAMGASAATISGTVTTGGGGGGTPVVGAKVVLTSLFGGGGGGAARLDSTVTSATGTYTFTTDSLGFKQILVTMTGFQNGQGFTNVQSRTGTYTVNIQLMATGGGGRTGIVTGTVRAGSATGTPVANALVVLIGTGGGGNPPSLDSTRTNAQGVYTFDSVAAVNNFTVRVTAIGFNPALNNNVDVTAGLTTTANFTLTVIPGVGIPGSVSGTIRNIVGATPIAGAKVVLIRTAGSTARIDSMVTGADGHFAFDSVAALANYTITVTATGFQTASNTNVDIVSNTTSTVDFSLIATTVTVTTGSIIGRVTNVGKVNIVGAKVVLSRTGGGGGNGIIDSAVTNASALQNYTVTVSATGYQNSINNNVDLVAGQAVLADFILVSTTSVRISGSSEASFRLSKGQGALSIEFAPSLQSGSLKAFTLRGAQSLSIPVPAGAAHLNVSDLRGVNYLVLSRGGRMERLSVPVGF
jgi:hypothetical protein